MSNSPEPGANTPQPGISITINIFTTPTGALALQTKVDRDARSSSPLSSGGGAGFESMPSEEFEAARGGKADDEQNMDYSDCQGFDPKFMGIHTPFPKPGGQLKRQLAILDGTRTQCLLNYYHYSTMQHSIRRMPVVSAINIDGDPAERQDKTPRKDEWLRDNRIDFDVQLNDAFYRSSGFDKGHMSRREDAYWDDTPDDATRDANLTCMYTNAVPQVPDINRAIYGYHGLWGQLEQIILEKGVEKEEGKTTRICVYNGPIFQEKDPVFKSVQVPLRFFKIVVWKNAAGKPRTTAFILSQENLVGGIQFEELQYDQEFKEHQCSVKFLEKLTQLEFTGIGQWDTYEGGDEGAGLESIGGGPGSPVDGDLTKQVRPIDREQLESLIKNNNA
jgi:endonuclease G